MLKRSNLELARSIAGTLQRSAKRENEQLMKRKVKRREAIFSESLNRSPPCDRSNIICIVLHPVVYVLFVDSCTFPPDMLMNIPPDIKENESGIDLSRVC